MKRPTRTRTVNLEFADDRLLLGEGRYEGISAVSRSATQEDAASSIAAVSTPASPAIC
ncbi:hypothetical protein ACNKHO_02315 [Shigella flexneri]